MHYRFVFMRFRDAVSGEQIRDVARRHAGFVAIDGVDWVRAGLTIEPSPRWPYTHALIVSFVDAQARDAYVNNPFHRAAQAAIHPLVEDFLIVDAEAESR